MFGKILRLSIAFFFLLSLVIDSASAQVRIRKAAFKDEFNGPAGTAIDASKWTSEIGGGGWGNQELEYYTNSTDNAYQDGNGTLVIKAVKLNPPLSLSCW